jgi:hypothetical protein
LLLLLHGEGNGTPQKISLINHSIVPLEQQRGALVLLDVRIKNQPKTSSFGFVAHRYYKISFFLLDLINTVLFFPNPRWSWLLLRTCFVYRKWYTKLLKTILHQQAHLLCFYLHRTVQSQSRFIAVSQSLLMELLCEPSLC